MNLLAGDDVNTQVKMSLDSSTSKRTTSIIAGCCAVSEAAVPNLNERKIIDFSTTMPCAGNHNALRTWFQVDPLLFRRAVSELPMSIIIFYPGFIVYFSRRP